MDTCDRCLEYRPLDELHRDETGVICDGCIEERVMEAEIERNGGL